MGYCGCASARGWILGPDSDHARLDDHIRRTVQGDSAGKDIPATLQHVWAATPPGSAECGRMARSLDRHHPREPGAGASRVHRHSGAWGTARAASHPGMRYATSCSISPRAESRQRDRRYPHQQRAPLSAQPRPGLPITVQRIRMAVQCSRRHQGHSLSDANDPAATLGIPIDRLRVRIRKRRLPIRRQPDGAYLFRGSPGTLEAIRGLRGRHHRPGSGIRRRHRRLHRQGGAVRPPQLARSGFPVEAGGDAEHAGKGHASGPPSGPALRTVGLSGLVSGPALRVLSTEASSFPSGRSPASGLDAGRRPAGL